MKRSYNDSGSPATMDRPPGLREGDAPVKPGKVGTDQKSPPNEESGSAVLVAGHTDAEQGETMKNAEAVGKPGPGHKALEHFGGDWKAEVKCWSDPNSPANVSQATATGTWIMNGRYLQEDFYGEMMGQRFHGRMLLGFDNVKQTFCSTWISDMQTSIFITEGKGENDNKVITLKGTTSCPMRQRGDIPMKIVLRVFSPDKHTFEMFDESSGTKTMEITYVRD